jgi:hypothetical protein
MHTPAGSSAATLNGSSSNGRLYRAARVSLLHGRVVPLIALVTLFGAFPVSAQTPGVLPTITPVQIQPLGPASGGGVSTRVTYEMRLAANDATVASAANDARYVARAVTIARPTLGGIVGGVVAGGARIVPWIAAALTAYELYKWYTDANGQLTAPAVSYPQTPCGSTGWWQAPAQSVCSLPAAERVAVDYQNRSFPGWGFVKTGTRNACTYTVACTAFVDMKGVNPYDHSVATNTAQVVFYPGANAGITDPAYTSSPVPVTGDQLGQLAEQHPDWWPDMLHDPVTGQPLITPEVAADMDALKHEIAPQYGVDPQTIPQTTPDPNYQQGEAQPRPQSLPDYCAWAARACKHFDLWDNLATIPTFDPTMGTDHPVSDVLVDKTDDGSASLDASGFLGGGACPGFAPIVYFGVTMNYGDGLCQTAGLIGPWLVGLGYALALLIGLRLKAGG